MIKLIHKVRTNRTVIPFLTIFGTGIRAKVMELSQIEMCALFYNLSTSNWAHHWRQFIPGTNGAGRMFADMENQRLYVFDSMAGAKTGALKTDSGAKKIELLPVTMQQMGLPNAFDVTWHGAVVTFDGTTPIYGENQGIKTGLWIVAEYPPSLT